MEERNMLGIIGGSGVYNIEGLENTRWVKAESSFGEPSDEILVGELAGQSIAFLPRHGRGHRLPPSAINFRANIDALKRLGGTDVISVSDVGSLREHLMPGMFVIIDQFIDRTISAMILQQALGLGLIGFVVGKLSATLWAPLFPKYVLLLPSDAVKGFVLVMLMCAIASIFAIRAALRIDPATAIGRSEERRVG